MILAVGYALFRFFRRLGPLGLFIMGALDSSFLFLPFGNDLLLIALVSSSQGGPIWIVYVMMSALGSVLGVLIVDVLMRKAGEKGLEKFISAQRITKLKKRMDKRAGRVVFAATLMPPPFPFTPIVMTASALQIPRRQLLAAVFGGRFLRFTIEALLALYFGRRVISYLRSDLLDYFVYAFIIVVIVGSIFSVRKWIR